MRALVRTLYELIKAIGACMAVGAGICALLYLSIYLIVVLIFVGVPLIIILKHYRQRRRHSGWDKSNR